MKLLMNDEVNYYASVWFPTHVITEDKDIVPVFIGSSMMISNPYTQLAVGIYVKDEDYEKIKHDSPYLLIHNPEAVKEDILNLNWDKFPDNVENHHHIYLRSEIIVKEKS